MDCAFNKENQPYISRGERKIFLYLLASSFQSTFPCVKVADLNAYFNFPSQKDGGNTGWFNSMFFGRAS